MYILLTFKIEIRNNIAKPTYILKQFCAQIVLDNPKAFTQLR